MPKSLLTFALLLALALCAHGQTPSENPTTNEDRAAVAAQALAQERATLLAELRTLEAEAKELLQPLDVAAAKTEVAAAAWPLERGWAKRLLRDALELTFPAEYDRPKTRKHAVGAPLKPPTPEDIARSMVRARILKVAARDPDFARELAVATARELGVVAEVSQYAQLASAAVRDDRLDEAGDLLLHAMETEPTLIEIGSVINEVAVRDRAAADRLMLRYVEQLGALPLAAFTERNHVGLRVAFSFMWMLVPDAAPEPFRAGPFPPPSREVIRAYVDFVVGTMTRIEQAHGDLTQMHFMLVTLWPLIARHAPEMTAQFNALERASRTAGAPAPALSTFAGMKASDDKRYEERLKIARQTKDALDLEVAASAAMNRKEFDEARKLIEMVKDEQKRSQLAEQVNVRESLYLTDKGELAGAERLARQLNGTTPILRAFPPLVRRFIKNKDAGAASMLAEEAVRRLKASAEKTGGDDSFVPALLASVADSIRVFKGSRALLAMSELALAVEPVGGPTALDILDALVETANKARITSENGNPNFNADVFLKLAARDEERARAAAARLEDRLQRIVALAAVWRGKAEGMNKKLDGAPVAKPKDAPVAKPATQ